MLPTTKQDRFRFWRSWTLFNSLGLFIGYIISFIISVFMAFKVFDLSKEEWGSPLEQTISFMVSGAIIGLCIGLTQWLLLRKRFKLSSFWVYSVAIGFIIAELIVGFVLWKLDINRGEHTFIEGKPVTHALILTFTGLIIGLIQLPMLKGYFSEVAYWIIASALAWGISILLTTIMHQSDMAVFITFVLGILLYGAITGATFIWLLRPKNIRS